MAKMKIEPKPMYFNTLGLKLGQKIKVSASSSVEYEWFENQQKTEKVILKNQFDHPREVFVVGVRKKALGEFHRGYVHGWDQDYEPAHLKVSKYVWFYECRKSIESRPFLVHPDDVLVEG